MQLSMKTGMRNAFAAFGIRPSRVSSAFTPFDLATARRSASPARNPGSHFSRQAEATLKSPAVTFVIGMNVMSLRLWFRAMLLSNMPGPISLLIPVTHREGLHRDSFMAIRSWLQKQATRPHRPPVHAREARGHAAAPPLRGRR
jgi:hypothetical protein